MSKNQNRTHISAAVNGLVSVPSMGRSGAYQMLHATATGFLLCALIASLLFGSTQTLSAQGEEEPSSSNAGATAENSEAAAEEEEASLLAGERPSGFSARAALTTSLGQGSFVADSGARNDFFSYNLFLQPSYTFKDGTIVSLNWSGDQQLFTDSAVIGANSPNDFVPGDVQLNARYVVGKIPGINTQFILRPALFFPTSRISQHQTRILQAQLGAQFLYVNRFMLVSLFSAVRKSWNRYKTATIGTPETGLPSINPRQGGAADIGEGTIATGQRNESWRLSNSLAVLFFPVGGMYVQIAYALFNLFNYGIDEDEYSGVHAQGGPGRVDFGNGNIEVGWQFSPMKSWFGQPVFIVAAGVNTLATPRSNDNERFRFPFFDFDGPATNRTTFYLSVSGTFNFRN